MDKSGLSMACLLTGLFFATIDVSATTTALQTAGASYVAFEGEIADLVAGTPENWTVKDDAAASGGKTLIIAGNNSTGDSPHSFAQFRIKFATAGTYFIYYRWQAEPARTAGDVFTANSIWIANRFGEFSTPGAAAQTDYIRSDSNNLNAPENSVYTWRRDVDTLVYTVGDPEIATPVILTMGTREAGFTLDRIVLSTDGSLTPAALDALLNSETDLIVQGAGETFVAWEAEAKAKLIAGTPENWVVKQDAAASGGATLIIAGNNSTGDSPHSFAQFRIKFATVGTYFIYYRWQAEPARTAGDVFTANSIWIANRFGEFSTPGAGAQTDYIRSDSNNLNAPENSVYTWRRDVDTLVYTVGDPEIAAPVTLTMGTREAGFTLDRIILSTDGALTPAALDALLNSGSKPVAPEIKSAVGSAALNTARVVFTRPLDPTSATPANFTIAGLTVNTVTVSPDDGRIVDLATAAQNQGTQYTINVTGVKDASGTTIAAGANTKFTAWRKVAGWATKEIYLGVVGGTVDTLLADPDFIAGNADRVEFVRGFQVNNDPLADNYGSRLSAFFKPSASGVHDFFPRNDDEAELQLSSDTTAANLAAIGRFPLQAAFDENVLGQSPDLTAGQDYLLAALLQQATGDVYLNVVARRNGDNTPLDPRQELVGDKISTFVNPDLGVVTFTTQPGNVTTTAGNRARFEVKVNALTQPVYYQWQKDGVDITGAIRPVYITPVLTTGDSGKNYRVVVTVAGTDTTSSAATLTVNAGTAPTLQPVVGVNFVGGGTAGGASLLPQDVAGVVQQENWNNLTGFTFDTAALLNDAAGGGIISSITLTVAGAAEVWYTGTKAVGDADSLLMQGFIGAVSSPDPVTLTLNNVPEGNYTLIAYTIGFDFSADYRELFEVTGASAYPALNVRGETGLVYANSPAYRRANSTNPDARETGNYVRFDNVSPATDGSLMLSVTWQGEAPGNGHSPAINALQLVRIGGVQPGPEITGISFTGGNIQIQYSGGTLETTTTINTGWEPVNGATPPTYSTTATGNGPRFFRVKQ